MRKTRRKSGPRTRTLSERRIERRRIAGLGARYGMREPPRRGRKKVEQTNRRRRRRETRALPSSVRAKVQTRRGKASRPRRSGRRRCGGGAQRAGALPKPRERAKIRGVAAALPHASRALLSCPCASVEGAPECAGGVQEERSCRARKGRGGGGGCADPRPRRAARGPRGPAPLPGAPDDNPDVSAVRHGVRCVREPEGSRGQTCVVLYLGVVIGAWVIIELLVSDALLQVQRPPPAARRPPPAARVLPPPLHSFQPHRAAFSHGLNDFERSTLVAPSA